MSLGSFQIVLTGDQFNALVAKLTAMGFSFGEDSAKTGTLPETSGVVLSYSVDGVPAIGASPVTITFIVQKKPFFASVGMIESKVKEEMGVS